MEETSTVKGLIDRFPTRKALADAVSRLGGVPVSTERVHGWAKAGSIPARFHRAFVLAAGEFGVAASAEMLDALHAPDVRGDAA